MKLQIELTDKFNYLIDYTEVSGIATYIDIPLSQKICSNFTFTLENFILNLNDNLITIIESGFNSQLKENLLEDGFFIVKSAKFHFTNVKGGDVILENISEKEHATYCNTWKYNLAKGDKIYELDGRMKMFPSLYFMSYIVSNGCIYMELDFNNFEYINSYKEFTERVEEINTLSKEQNPIQKAGQLFSSDFRAAFFENKSEEEKPNIIKL